MRKDVTIGIVGAGGDGVLVMAGILLNLAAEAGYYAWREQHTGPQIRGGDSAVIIHISKEPILMPSSDLSVLVCFNWQKFLNFQKELLLNKDTIVFYDDDLPPNLKLAGRFIRIPFSKISMKATRKTQSKNIVALGLTRKSIGLRKRGIKTIISRAMSLTREQLEENISVLKLGESLFEELVFSAPRLYPSSSRYPKIILHGNEAIARGIIKAGCRFSSSYPITPASEIMDYLSRELPKLGGLFVQTEDEISAMGFSFGASLTGEKASDSVSGPGFSLKTEMMGLATADEIPLVLVDVQRCGPSTGIPSKTEQSDLNHAIFGGHGDAPRVVLASFNLESCYRLAIEAHNIAEEFQTLVILLSDQWLGQTLVAVDGDFLEKEYVIKERLKPGWGDRQSVCQTTGLTHNEKGEPSSDPEIHQLMHEKRWKKLLPLAQREDLVKIFGNPTAQIGIITWGSSGQAILGTVKAMGLEKDIKICVPELIHPLPEKPILRFLRKTNRLLVVEMNHSGQFYHYLRSLIDLPRRTRVYKRAGGRPFSIREFSQPILEVLK